MEKSILKIETLKRVSQIVTSLWVLAQIVLVIIFFNIPQRSDWAQYIEMATRCFENNEWYPMKEHIYDSYIWAPGLINYFVLQLKLFGTIKFNVILNLIMNIFILYEVRFLARKFFSLRISYISVICFCFLYSNLLIILLAGTEIPFLFLILSGFCLCLSRKCGCLILAGILFILANWVRPLTLIFVPAVLLYMYLNKYNWKHFTVLFVSMVCVVVCIGGYTQKKTGYFSFQSSTSGVNLIMSANDEANGGVCAYLLNDSASICYIKDADRLTFAEKDFIWKQRAIEWIKDHPGRFVKLYCMKLFILYYDDSWPERCILSEGVGSMMHRQVSKSSFIIKMLDMGLKSLTYYILWGFFIYALLKHRKEIISQKGLLLLIFVLGTFSTCLFSIGVRYHYPFLFTVVIWGAYGIDTLLFKIKNSRP